MFDFQRQGQPTREGDICMGGCLKIRDNQWQADEAFASSGGRHNRRAHESDWNLGAVKYRR